MAAKSLQDLFVGELRDAYDGEKRLTKALPRMAKAAENEDLRAAFTSHLRETERHVQRLEQVFRTIGEPVRGKKCDGLMGIIEEGKSAMEELEGPVRDAALIAGAQRAEHYEQRADLHGPSPVMDRFRRTIFRGIGMDDTLRRQRKGDQNGAECNYR